MKIFLPSNNMMGLTSIEMRDPKIGDLRVIPNLAQSQILKKTQFVRMLVGDEVDNITPQDRDYLFVIAVGAVTLNQIGMAVRCSCGQELTGAISLGEIEPTRLRRSVRKEYKAKIYGHDYTFHKLTVKDETLIEERAIDLPDEDYDKEFQDGQVARTLGWSVEQEDIERVRKLDLSLYFAALLYNNCDPHGVVLTKAIKCPKCGKEFVTHLPITGDMLNINVAQVMSRYVSVNQYVSMDNYFEMTLPEYNTFIQSLNEKLRNKKKR